MQAVEKFHIQLKFCLEAANECHVSLKRNLFYLQQSVIDLH